MERERNEPAIAAKIGIGCKDWYVKTYCGGANQEVGIGALDSVSTADIEKLRAAFKIVLFQRSIRKSMQMLHQTQELCFLSNSGKNFLPHRTQHYHTLLADQFAKLPDYR